MLLVRIRDISPLLLLLSRGRHPFQYVAVTIFVYEFCFCIVNKEMNSFQIMFFEGVVKLYSSVTDVHFLTT